MVCSPIFHVDLIEQLNRQISVGQSEKKAVEVAAEEALEEAAKDAEMAIQMLNVELAEKDTVINKRNGKCIFSYTLNDNIFQ